jgi:hypothetical protein
MPPGLQKKPRRVCRPQAANKMESFLAGACTWPKILLSLQVWNLFAFSGQIMRAADCKPFAPKGQRPFGAVSALFFTPWAAAG